MSLGVNVKSREWKHSIYHVKRKLTSQPVVGEGIFSLFQDLQGQSLAIIRKEV
jgi:hypothetical protein